MSYLYAKVVLVFHKNHYVKKSDVLNNSQISKLHGVDYEFIPFSKGLREIKHLTNNMFSPLMVNVIYTKGSLLIGHILFFPLTLY